MRLCIHSRELPNLMLLWMEFVLFSILYALASRKFNPTLQVSKGFYFILFYFNRYCLFIYCESENICLPSLQIKCVCFTIVISIALKDVFYLSSCLLL
jgi:hypothetical protein